MLSEKYQASVLYSGQGTAQTMFVDATDSVSARKILEGMIGNGRIVFGPNRICTPSWMKER